MNEVHTVTGAFGFTGKYLTRLLLNKDCHVRTLTNSPHRENIFTDRIEVAPLNFDNYSELVNSLQGTTVLYNTYWIRFNYSKRKVLYQHSIAAANTLKLFQAAKEAGVSRIVHISIANASEDSPFEYYQYKARIENFLLDLGVSYAVLRPAVIFGKEDILINNLAWSIRRLPVFAIFGNGSYKLQPVFVNDLAELMIEAGLGRDNLIRDAAGPETYTYYELIKMLCNVLQKKRIIVKLPPAMVYYSSKLIDLFTGDVLLTRDEMNIVRSNLMYSKQPPNTKTRLSNWCMDNVSTLGKHYANEVERRMNRNKPYF